METSISTDSCIGGCMDHHRGFVQYRQLHGQWPIEASSSADSCKDHHRGINHYRQSHGPLATSTSADGCMGSGR